MGVISMRWIEQEFGGGALHVFRPMDYVWRSDDEIVNEIEKVKKRARREV